MSTDHLDARREKLLLFVLAAIQFTNIMDFMIMMPLGPQLMRLFQITPAQFSIIVSSYTLTAGVTGFLSSFFIDRYGRKRALAVIYAGFVVGTLACALSPNYLTLVAARVLTGVFGGLLGALVLSIVGDAIPLARRGRAMGIVMTAFSVASVFGVPFGLFIAARWSWHAPFLFLAGIGVLIFVAIVKAVPPLRGHIQAADIKESPLALLKEILANRNQMLALSLTPILMLAHFTLIPLLSAYMVSNVGFTDHDLTYIYFLGGLATIFTSPRVGKLVDRIGANRVFRVATVLCVVPLLLITNLPQVPIGLALAVTTSFFIIGNARIVPCMTLVTSTVAPKRRGGFMSINSSLQQLFAGLAAMLGGTIVAQAQDGRLLHYNRVGFVCAIASVVLVAIAAKVRPLA